MANQTVDTAKTFTLGANAASQINFSGVTAPTDVVVEVINLDASAVVWASFGGVTAAVEGDNSVPILPSTRWVAPVDTASFALISSGTPKVCVRRVS